MIPASTAPRLLELDGLRGWLALWVVNAHVIQFGLVREAFPGSSLAGLLGHGELAVAVFVILSGFVIGRQLRVAPEPYPVFLLRRFMRLYPVFLICFAAGVALYSVLPMFAAQKAELLEHVLLHVTMMHGVVPDTWLADSSTAFLAPGWSVSVEWQFYVVAPLFALALALPRWRWAVIGGAALMVLFAAQLHVHWSKPSMLLLCLHLFLLGMVTDQWIAAVERGTMPGDGAVRAALCVAFLAALALQNLPVAAWLFVTLMLMPGTDRVVRPVAEAWRFAMGNPLAQYLGRISYSLYLSHYLVLEAVAWVARSYLGLDGMMALPLLYASVIPCVLLADLLFRTVEAPGIRLGRKVARSLLPTTGPSALS